MWDTKPFWAGRVHAGFCVEASPFHGEVRSQRVPGTDGAFRGRASEKPPASAVGSRHRNLRAVEQMLAGGELQRRDILAWPTA